jgi:peptidoglycan/LPS O-acetylase OafA/YrhL
LPSYLFVLAVLFAVGFAHFDSAATTVRQIALHLAFIHTWFPDTYGTIDGVLWSLGVEVQFYVLFPLLCWAALRLPWATFAGMTAVAVAYRFGALALAGGDQLGGYISQVFGVLDLFAAGMAAAYVFRLLAVRRPALAAKAWLWTIVAVAALGCSQTLAIDLFHSDVHPHWADNWYVWGRTPLALAFFALTVGSLFAVRWWRAAIANPAFVFFSVISYNLYLWHAVIAEYVRTLPIFPWHEVMPFHALRPEMLSYELTAATLSILVAMVPTYLIERPLLRVRLPGRESTSKPAPATASGRS